MIVLRNRTYSAIKKELSSRVNQMLKIGREDLGAQLGPNARRRITQLAKKKMKGDPLGDYAAPTRDQILGLLDVRRGKGGTEVINRMNTRLSRDTLRYRAKVLRETGQMLKRDPYLIT